MQKPLIFEGDVRFTPKSGLARLRGLHRRYVLEQVDGELVFRQTEVDAIVADLLDELLFGIKPPESRRIIKQP